METQLTLTGIVTLIMHLQPFEGAVYVIGSCPTQTVIVERYILFNDRAVVSYMKHNRVQISCRGIDAMKLRKLIIHGHQSSYAPTLEEIEAFNLGAKVGERLILPAIEVDGEIRLDVGFGIEED